jgi:anti-sigma factor RsiW
MVCRDVRELADAFLSDQLLVETTQEMVRHLESCPECRHEIETRRELRNRLQSAFGSAPALAPRQEFADQLRARLQPRAAAGVSRRDVLRSWWAIAAGAVLAAGGGLAGRSALHRSRLAELARSAAGDHQNCAIKFNLTERPISLQDAARRFDPAYAGLVALQAPEGSSMEVVERHSCEYQGRRFAHVVYRYQGHVVSLLVTASTEGESATPAMLPRGAEGQWSVASFSSPRHLIFVVSDLDDRDTLAVADALARPVADSLAGA